MFPNNVSFHILFVSSYSSSSVNQHQSSFHYLFVVWIHQENIQANGMTRNTTNFLFTPIIISYKTICAIYIMIQLFTASSFQIISRNSYRNARSFRRSPICTMTIADTPLGTEEGKALLDGLDVYTVPASGDDHPISVYGIDSENPKPEEHILLLLHGRTWSSVPVYHLLGGPKNAGKGLESRSMMEALRDKNIRPYAMDFRGFGGTPREIDSDGVDPNRCVEDVESVLGWIAGRHGTTCDMLNLLGWSQGALVAQIAAQRRRPKFGKLVLYGSIVDPMVRYPREPLYTLKKEERTDIINTYDSAVEDFTIEGTIPSEPARVFAEAALTSDPIKMRWKHVYQFNNCDASRVHVPTLVVSGDQDPYAPLYAQQELFTRLGAGSDKTWSIVADADHAAHLLEGRGRFMNLISSFVKNGKMSDADRP